MKIVEYALRAHQKHGLNLWVKMKTIGMLLWHEMGTGKTLTALEVINYEINKAKRAGAPPNPKALVLHPKSVYDSWDSDIKRFTPHLRRHIVFLSIDSLAQLPRLLRHCNFVIVVGDEWHKLKNLESKRSLNFVEALKMLPVKTKLLFLSGTPVLNHAGEWYAYYAACIGKDLNDSVKLMEDTKARRKWVQASANVTDMGFKKVSGRGNAYGGSIEKISGIRDAEKVMSLVSRFTDFVPMSAVTDLPPQVVYEIYLKMNEETLFLNIQKEVEKLVKGDEDTVKATTQLIRKNQLNISLLLKELSIAKTPFLIEWINNFRDIDPNKQLVVFSPHTEPLFELERKFGKEVVLIHGGLSRTERSINIKKFQHDKAKIIALTYGAGAEGLNLQCAHVTVYLGLPWTWGLLKQSMARTHRTGQENKTLHYKMFSGEWEKKVYEVVYDKKEMTVEMEDIMEGSMDETMKNSNDDIDISDIF